MAKYSSTVQYNIKTTLDATGITKLQTAIDKTQTELKKMNALELIRDSEYRDAMAKLNNLQKAMQRSFNSNLGMLNLKTFRSELAKSGTSIADIGNSFKKAGHVGEQSFNQFLGRVGKIDTGLQNVNKTADKVFNTIGNTVRWGIIASGFQTVLNNAHKAVTYMRDLDKSLTNIRMVTNYSKKDMREFAEYANKAAQALGSTTTKYTDAALIFAQQGYDLKSSSQLGEHSIKLANVTGQDTATTSDQLTSYMNAYQMDLEDIGTALDKWAEVANVSAADVEELSVATQKAGSTAATVGVNMDQLAAQIATIESVTRDAPENIGNGLKTMYARFSDLSLGKTLGDGMDLGKVSGTLEGMGVEVINKETGVMNDVGVIMENLMEVWDTLDQGQKAAAAQTLAGKYQMNRLMALMENSDMYEKYKTSSETANGTLDTMNDEYLESVEGRLQTLYASAQGLVSELFNQDSIGPFLDGLSDALNLMTKFTETIGGSQNLLLGLGATATKVFNNQIGRSINDTIGNIKAAKTKRDNLAEGKRVLQDLGLNQKDLNRNGSLASYAAHGQQYGKYMSEDQQAAYNKNLEETVRLKNKEADIRHQKDASVLATNAAYRLAGADQDVITKNLNGSLDTSGLQSMPKLSATQVEQVAKSLDIIDDRAVAATQGIVKLSTELNKGNVTSTEFSQALGNARQRIEAIGKDTGVSAETLKKYTEQLNAIENEATSATPDLEKMRAATEKLNKELNEFRQLSRTAKDNPKGTVITSAKGADALVNAESKAAAESAAQAQKNLADQTAMINQRAIASTINFAGSIGQLAFAVQSFQSLGSIWKRDDIEIGEKILSTVMNVGMALPMLIGGVQAAVEMASALKLATMGAVAAKQAESAEYLKNTITLEANSAAKARSINAIRGASAAHGQENALLAVNTIEQKTNTNAKKMNIIQTKLATLATKGFAGALASMILPVAGVVAALGALVLAAKGIYDWYNKDAQAAEEAKENANELRTVYEDLGNNLEEFQSDLSAYNDAKDALSGLKKGTKEWADALAKANNSLIDIITKYPELAKYITRTKDGVLTISQEGIEAFVQQQEEGLLNAQIGSVTGSIAASDAQLVADGTSLHRTIGNGFGQAELDTLVQAYADGQNIMSESVLAELLPHLPEEAIIEIAARSGEIAKYCEQINAQEESSQAQQEALVESILSQDQKWVNNDKIDKEQTVSNIVDYAESLMPEKITEYHTLSNDDLADQYIESTYGADSGYTAEVSGDNLKVLDETGEEVATLSKDAAINSMASAEALKEAAEMWKEIARMFNGIGSTETNVGAVSANTKEVLKTSSPGGTDFDFSSMSTAEKEKVKSAGTGENGTLTAGDLGMTDEAAKARGYEDAEAYAKAFNEGLQNSIDLDSALSSKYFDEDGAVKAKKEGGVTAQEAADLAEASQDSNQLWNSGAAGKGKKQYSEKEILDQQTIADDESKSQEQRDAAAESAQAMRDANAEAAIVSNAYTEALGRQASAFSELDEEAKKLSQTQQQVEDAQEGVTSATEEVAEAKEAEAKAQKKVDTFRNAGVDPEVLAEAEDELAKATEDVGKAQEKLNKKTKALDKTTDKYSKGQRTLRNNLIREEWDAAKKSCESYIKTLKKGEKDNKGFAQAAEQVASELTEVSGVEVSSDWVKDNLDLIEDWQNGVEGATSELQVAIGLASDEMTGILSKMPENVSSAFAGLAQGLEFDVTGRADFESLFTGLHQLDEDFLSTKEKAGNLVDALSCFGTTQLELIGKNGEVTTLDLEAISEGGINDAELKQLQDYVTGLFNGTYSIKGVVPDKSLKNTKSIGQEPKTPKAPSGGGGSKGSSKKTKKDKKEHEYDRYKRVNRQLEKIAANYEKLANESSRLFGAEWRENLEAQNRELDKQLEKLQRKKQLQEDEKNESKSKLSSFGVKFDQYGAMTNFNQIRQGLVDDYNRAVASGNEKAIERAEKALENFDKWIDSYESAVSGIEDTDAEIESTMDQMEDNAIALFNAFSEGVEAIEELNRAMAEFNGTVAAFAAGDMDDPFVGMRTSADSLLDYLDRDFVNTLGGTMSGIKIWGPDSAYTSTDGRGHGTISMAAQYAQNTLDEYKKFKAGEKNVFGENSAAAKEALETAQKNLQEAITTAIEDWNQLNEQVLAAEENIAESIDKRQEKYQAINDTLEHQKSLTEMIYGEEAYELLDQIYEAQQKNAQARLFEKRNQKEILEEELAAMRARGEEGSDLYKQMEQRLMDTEAEIQDLILENMELIREQYEKTVEAVLKAWTSNAFGGTDLDWIETEWELIERNSEQYLDNVNAAYETQKLQAKYIELLDGETNLHNQQLITAQMNQQLDYLREKDKLSEYDVAYANAQLEILQKRIALEDARNNKSQMKLKRDSQGNYGYVYTADEGDIASAESDLLDAENEAYNLSKDNMIEMQNNSMSALKDAYSTIQDIWTNANLTLEEKSERTQTVIDSLKEYLAGTAEQLSVSEQNLINDFFAMVDGMSGENSARLTDAFNELVDGNYEALDLIDDRFDTSITTWLKDLESFEDGCGDMMEGLVDAAQEMESDIDDVADAVGEDFTDIQSGVEGCTDATRELTESSQEFFDTIASQTTIMDGYQRALTKIKDEILSMNEDYETLVSTLQAENTRLEQENAALKGETGSGSGNPTNPTSPTNNTDGDGKLQVGDTVTLKNTALLAESSTNVPGLTPDWSAIRGETLYVQDYEEGTKAPWHIGTKKKKSEGGWIGWVRKSSLAGYDTGGYTGSWNNGDPDVKNGKLAYLHQKELVLNEADTKNLLAAIEIVRGLTDSLKNSSLAQLSSSFGAFIGSTIAPETIEQRVSIEASFPGVKDSSEIERALLNLSDQAYQWAHRYR